MRDHKNLKAWEKAHELALVVYRLTIGLPEAGRFGLRSQMRKAAVSMPANVAEGYGRAGDGELRRFISIARRSSSELSYQLLWARDFGYVHDHVHARLEEKLNEVQKMLRSFWQRLRTSA